MPDTTDLRELDAEVAEVVFGYTLPEGRQSIERRWQEGAALHIEVAGLPFYSTDMNTAMQVVEKLMAQGFHPCLFHVERWHCVFNRPEDRGVAPGRFAPTPAEAICRAALACLGKAKGGDAS